MSCRRCDVSSGLFTAGNVLIDVSFRAKLADFGLSQKKTHCGFVGTPYWMAPELLAMQQPTVKSDCYAMVCVIIN